MANTIVEPVMNLVLPTPGSDPGPDYANNQNQDLLIIASHTHGPGSGVQVTPTGLNINTNLPFNNNSATGLFGVQFSLSTSSSLTRFLYTAPQSGGGIDDLFYNDGAGNVIALTKAGLVNATIASLPGESYAGGTFTWKQGSGSTTPANFDIGSVTIRPNTAGTTNGVVLGPPSGISSLYNLQLPPVPGVTSFVTIDSSGNINPGPALAAGISTTNIANQSITQIKLAPKTTGSTVAAGGVGISSSSVGFNTTSGSPVSVTNLSVTITTTGRPVYLFLQNDGLGNGAAVVTLIVTNSGAALNGSAQLYFNNSISSVEMGSLQFNTPVVGTFTESIPSSSFLAMDLAVNGLPGTYTYSILASVNGSGTSNTIAISNTVLVAYEI
jgi:hypothetical protein